MSNTPPAGGGPPKRPGWAADLAAEALTKKDKLRKTKDSKKKESDTLQLPPDRMSRVQEVEPRRIARDEVLPGGPPPQRVAEKKERPVQRNERITPGGEPPSFVLEETEVSEKLEIPAVPRRIKRTPNDTKVLGNELGLSEGMAELVLPQMEQALNPPDLDLEPFALKSDNTEMISVRIGRILTARGFWNGNSKKLGDACKKFAQKNPDDAVHFMRALSLSFPHNMDGQMRSMFEGLARNQNNRTDFARDILRLMDNVVKTGAPQDFAQLHAATTNYIAGKPAQGVHLKRDACAILQKRCEVRNPDLRPLSPEEQIRLAMAQQGVGAATTTTAAGGPESTRFNNAFSTARSRDAAIIAYWQNPGETGFNAARQLIGVLSTNLDAEGIYRHQPSEKVVDSLREGIRNGDDLVEKAGGDMHSTAVALKRALAGAVPRPAADALVNAAKDDNLQTRENVVQILRANCSVEHAALLDDLFTHLADVANHSDTNKMRAENIAIAFAPSLLDAQDMFGAGESKALTDIITAYQNA